MKLNYDLADALLYSMLFFMILAVGHIFYPIIFGLSGWLALITIILGGWVLKQIIGVIKK